MKDLFKPGRVFEEYIDEDGNLRRDCITCLHRDNMEKSWGAYLCSGGRKRYWECNPNVKKPERLFWEPRVEGFIKEEEFGSI